MALTKGLPSWKNAVLALLAAVLLILAFPDFDYWFLAWVALVPVMWAVEREKESTSRSVLVGWIFGTAFFFGTCWWLTYAPITYAGFPPSVAYLLFFCVAAVAGLFPAMFAGVLSVLLRRFGSLAFLAAPFVWVATEFLRYWVTGNNWNAIGYSQVSEWVLPQLTRASTAPIGGVLMTSGFVVVANCGFHWWLISLSQATSQSQAFQRFLKGLGIACCGLFLLMFIPALIALVTTGQLFSGNPVSPSRFVIAVQPNVPMSGLDERARSQLRQRQIQLAEKEIEKTAIRHQPNSPLSIFVILPESPMNFMYNDDREFQQFIGDFARRNSVSVLFNSAEPDASNGKFFNSAVMVGPQGGEIGQYDKIYLLPFGESVPAPLRAIVPAFVGSFSYGSEYDLLPLGDAKAGVMICFESHFGELSREYVRNGADVLIEMTNDGYLGPTPVLRQHLANAVFRAVETNRPVLRVTNVGVTAYISEKGEVLDAAPVYQEDTRVWSVSKSDGSQTFYVRFGDWFAWLCLAVTAGLLVAGMGTRKIAPDSSATSA